MSHWITFILGFSLALSVSAFAEKKYETKCKNGNCYKFGWLTTGPDRYTLDTDCKNNDCKKYGWRSKVSDGSEYDV